MATKKKAKRKAKATGPKKITLYAFRSPTTSMYMLLDEKPDAAEAFPLTVRSLDELKALIAAEKADKIYEWAGEDDSVVYDETTLDPLATICENGFRAAFGKPKDVTLQTIDIEVSETAFPGRSLSIWVTIDWDDEVMVHLTEPTPDTSDNYPMTFDSRDEIEDFLANDDEEVTGWIVNGMATMVRHDFPELFGITLDTNTVKRLYVRRAK